MTTESSVLSNGMKQPIAIHSLIIYLIVLIGYIILSSFGEFIPKKPPIQLIWIMLPSVALILFPVLIYTHLKGFDIKESFNIRIPRFSTYLVSILVMISGLTIITAINSLLTPFFKPYETSLKTLDQHLLTLAHYNIYWLFLGTTLIPAICEELLFRGFILKGFMNSIGKTQAIIITALLFGIMHFLLPRMIMTTLIGILFGVLLILTNSIIIPITGHFINNVIVILFLLKSKGEFPDSFVNAGFPLPIIGIAIVLFISGIYWLARNNSIENKTHHRLS